MQQPPDKQTGFSSRRGVGKLFFFFFFVKEEWFLFYIYFCKLRHCQTSSTLSGIVTSRADPTDWQVACAENKHMRARMHDACHVAELAARVETNLKGTRDILTSRSSNSRQRGRKYEWWYCSYLAIPARWVSPGEESLNRPREPKSSERWQPRTRILHLTPPICSIGG